MSSKKVQVFFVGPPKTGTTWIYEYLKMHPDTKTSQKDKEVEFFNKFFYKGYDWYLGYFDTKTDRLNCDISPSYFISDLSMLRIREYNSKAKIIVTLRDPINRLLSHFKHYVKLGISDPDPVKGLCKNANLLSYSQYTIYIKKWQKYFPSQNINFLPIELLREDPIKYINKLCAYLEIKPYYFNDLLIEKVNKEGYSRNRLLAKYSTKVRQFLNDNNLNTIVRFLKGVGVKKLLYTGGRPVDIKDAKLLKSLQTILQEDIEFFNSIYKK